MDGMDGHAGDGMGMQGMDEHGAEDGGSRRGPSIRPSHGTMAQKGKRGKRGKRCACSAALAVRHCTAVRGWRRAASGWRKKQASKVVASGGQNASSPSPFAMIKWGSFRFSRRRSTTSVSIAVLAYSPRRGGEQNILAMLTPLLHQSCQVYLVYCLARGT